MFFFIFPDPVRRGDGWVPGVLRLPPRPHPPQRQEGEEEAQPRQGPRPGRWRHSTFHQTGKRRVHTTVRNKENLEPFFNRNSVFTKKTLWRVLLLSYMGEFFRGPPHKTFRLISRERAAIKKPSFNCKGFVALCCHIFSEPHLSKDEAFDSGVILQHQGKMYNSDRTQFVSRADEKKNPKVNNSPQYKLNLFQRVNVLANVLIPSGTL